MRHGSSGLYTMDFEIASLPILLPVNSVNQMLPSGPVVIAPGCAVAVGTGYCVIVPPTVILPILLKPDTANHKLPSGPAVMPSGVGHPKIPYRVRVPDGVILLTM